MPRNPDLSKDLRNHIRNRWLYGHMSCPEITAEINADRKLRSKYGEMSEQSVYYHLNKIVKEFDSYDNDAMQRFRLEFYRMQETMDQEVADLNDMIRDCGDKELKVRLMRFRHEILMDKTKILGDKEVPMQLRMIEEINNKSKRLKKVDTEEPPMIDKFKPPGE